MLSSVVFHGGGETSGGIGDRRIETAKQESTGGVGARSNQASIFDIDNELKEDTVCFRGKENSKNSNNTGLIFTTIAADAAILMGLLGLAYKHNWFGNISNENAKKFFDHVYKIAKPCYEGCKWIKNNSYDKIATYIKH